MVSVKAENKCKWKEWKLSATENGHSFETGKKFKILLFGIFSV